MAEQTPDSIITTQRNGQTIVFPPLVRLGLLCGLRFTDGLYQPGRKAQRKAL